MQKSHGHAGLTETTIQLIVVVFVLLKLVLILPSCVLRSVRMHVQAWA